MGKCILVTGGARSGKSTFSETTAKSYGERILYIATAIPFDDEMKDRIEKHKEKRNSKWTTIESFEDIAGIIRNMGDKYDCIILDCITVMVTNQILNYFDYDLAGLDIGDFNKVENILVPRINDLLIEIAKTKSAAVLVTNEVGWGIVPENFVARAFRDIYGRINQILGEGADEVYLTVCGIPIKIKG
ncbi:MAG: bifunctional adenosylcobinamide kinase/adenosylcobinamide-phosphate guanylyltransferase [Clostridiales bacterium]|nr:bifunctional adenosylcobinamide kinase/adenosylcobinamide-phosphate guanylyltransferase [Clostridiales bacterium]